jgi:hypothetical protein
MSNLLKQSPLNNDHLSTTANLQLVKPKKQKKFHWKISTEQPPMYDSHFFWVTRVAVVGTFDCIYI